MFKFNCFSFSFIVFILTKFIEKGQIWRKLQKQNQKHLQWRTQFDIILNTVLDGELVVPYSRNPLYAGSNAVLGVRLDNFRTFMQMLNLRSCAMLCYEPCQGWKAAALNRFKYVP